MNHTRLDLGSCGVFVTERGLGIDTTPTPPLVPSGAYDERIEPPGAARQDWLQSTGVCVRVCVCAGFRIRTVTGMGPGAGERVTTLSAVCGRQACSPRSSLESLDAFARARPAARAKYITIIAL